MNRPYVSAVIPMYQEVENAASTLATLGEALQARGWDYELVPVSDGSSDGTGEKLHDLAAQDGRINPVVYKHNRGRGYALRQGFAQARGHYVVALDADLSLGPDVMVLLVETLSDDPEIDMVIASCHMPGGGLENVPFIRVAFSKAGNVILRRTMAQPIYTSTGVGRGYRSETLRALELSADDKDIHLEILSQAMSLGMRIVEVPVVLRSRTKGSSKFRPRRTVKSHLLFGVMERSVTLFSLIGLVLLILATALAGYLGLEFTRGELNPERPLMTVMVLLFLGGAVSLSFSLIGLQMVGLRRQLVRLQAQVKGLREDVGAIARSGSDD